MHSIIRGQRKAVIAEIEKRFKQAGIGGEVRADPVLKKEFYIEIDSEVLIEEIRQILKAICKDKQVTMQGGLFEGDIAKSRQKPSKPINAIADKVVVADPPSRDYQIWEKVIILLSNHRSPITPAIPLPLTKRQILSLLTSSLSPDYPQEKLSQELDATLRELEAQGEIYTSVSNQSCIAQPNVLYEKALFRGDRAYLHLAHQLLGNPVSDSAELAFPEIDFDHLREKLLGGGINLVNCQMLTA